MFQLEIPSRPVVLTRANCQTVKTVTITSVPISHPRTVCLQLKLR